MHFRRNQDLTYWATGPSPRCSSCSLRAVVWRVLGRNLLRAAVFSDRLPGFDQTLAGEISGQVQAAGYATEFIGTTVLTNPALLTARSYDLLVLPGARSLPMAAAPAITELPARGRRSAGAGAAGVAVAAVPDQGQLDVAGEL